MAKIGKLMYYTSQNIKKINCYKINIPKKILKESNISENDDVKIYVKDGKIIIEKE